MRVKPQWKKQGRLFRSRQTQPCVWLDFYIFFSFFFFLYGVSKKETPRRRSTTEILDVYVSFGGAKWLTNLPGRRCLRRGMREQRKTGEGGRKKQSNKTKRLAGGYSFVWCVGGGRGEETDGGGGGGGSEETARETKKNETARRMARAFFCFFFPSSVIFLLMSKKERKRRLGANKV